MNTRSARYIQRCVARYHRLLLPHWEHRVLFETPVDADDPQCYAGAEYQPIYSRYELAFDLAHPNLGRKEPIWHLCRHEVLHALISPLAELLREHGVPENEIEVAEERVVTDLERAPFWPLLEKRRVNR